jgi:putative transposase
VVRTLRRWVEEYRLTGTLHEGFVRKQKYSERQKQAAIDYYVNHGRCINKAVRALGYPNRSTLGLWLDETLTERHTMRKGRISQQEKEFTPEQKKSAVMDLCLRDGPADEVAERHGVTRTSLYAWKRALLGEGYEVVKNKPDGPRTGNEMVELTKEVQSLQEQVKALEEEIYRLRMERDILELTAELLKKDPGVDPKNLTNREKTMVIDALKSKYSLKQLLKHLRIAKSSYFYQRAAMAAGDKYAKLRKEVHVAFSEAKARYGYRRIHAVLARNGRVISEKVVLRIMKEEQLIVIRRQGRKYNSYKGEITPPAPNLLQRDFRAEAPSKKWLTDITEFSIPAGKVYLSPIVDCFDGAPVSWSIGTSPNAELVNSMLDSAILTLDEGEEPWIHSDRGVQYQWPGWLELIESAGLARSMSRKACVGDNAPCEGFFGHVKNEMFYGRSWAGVSIEEFIEILDRYLRWFYEKRIKISLGGRSPMEYRRSLGLAA